MKIKPNGLEYLEEKARGYISFYRGNIPYTFAKRVEKGVIPSGLLFTPVIKSLTNGVIDSNGYRIDEYYDELSIDKGVCVELVFLDEYWYVTSSDGLKMV
jgi:hypothetical protein